MLHREPVKKTIYENRYKYLIPSNDEMRIVAKANQQCFYYLVGIEKCAEKVMLGALKGNADTQYSFDECRPVAESYYRCVTKDEYGTRLEAMDEAVRPYFKNFTQCVFKQGKSIDECRKYHDDILRHYARQPDNKLSEVYSNN